MATGLCLVHALKLVALGLRAEIAVILRLQMVARIVWAKTSIRATHKPVQVRLVCVNEPMSLLCFTQHLF